MESYMNNRPMCWSIITHGLFGLVASLTSKECFTLHKYRLCSSWPLCINSPFVNINCQNPFVWNFDPFLMSFHAQFNPFFYFKRQFSTANQMSLSTSTIAMTFTNWGQLCCTASVQCPCTLLWGNNECRQRIKERKWVDVWRNENRTDCQYFRESRRWDMNCRLNGNWSQLI